METVFLGLLKKRSAYRAISPEPLEENQRKAILEAAQLSASCMNHQPWRFLVLDEPEALEKGREALAPGNYWARTAPLLIVGFSRKELDCHMGDGREYYLFDLGMAVQNILLQATELGLVARPMAGFQPETLHKAFGLPETYRVLIMIAIGAPGDLAGLNEKHQAVSRAARVRRPLEENFFLNRFPPETDAAE